jgi:hypothetical protein
MPPVCPSNAMPVAEKVINLGGGLGDLMPHIRGPLCHGAPAIPATMQPCQSQPYTHDCVDQWPDHQLGSAFAWPAFTRARPVT